MAEFTDPRGRKIEIDGDVLNALNSAVGGKSGSKSDDKIDELINKTNKVSEQLKKLESKANKDKLADSMKEACEYFDEVSKFIKEQRARNKKQDKASEKFGDPRALSKLFSSPSHNKKDPMERQLASAMIDLAHAGTRKGSIYVHDFHATQVLKEISKDIKMLGRTVQAGLIAAGHLSAADITGTKKHGTADTFKKGKFEKNVLGMSGQELANAIGAAIRTSTGAAEGRSVGGGVGGSGGGSLGKTGGQKAAIRDIEKELKDNLEAGGSKKVLMPEAAEKIHEVLKGTMSIDEIMGHLVANQHKGTTEAEATAKAMKKTAESANLTDQALNAAMNALQRHNHVANINKTYFPKIKQILENMPGLTDDALRQFARLLDSYNRLDKFTKNELKRDFDALNDTLAKQPENLVAIEKIMGRIIDKSERLSTSTGATGTKLYDLAQKLSTIHRAAATFQPANVGLGTTFDPADVLKQGIKQSNEWAKMIHNATFQSLGLTGSAQPSSGKAIPAGMVDLGFGIKKSTSEYSKQADTATEAGQAQINYYNEGLNFQKLLLETGQDAETVQKGLIKNMQRGVTQQGKWNRLTKQGMQLATVIGSDAEATADELANWNQHMQLSVTQTGILARNIQMIGRLTGVSGQNLLQATVAGRQLAEALRDAGTSTADASKSLIQYAAVAKKLGTEKYANPIIEALSSTVNFFDKANDKTMSLLAMTAGFSKNPAAMMTAMQQGQVLNTPGMGMDFANSMEKLLMKFTGGRKVEDLSPKDKMVLNLVLESAFGMQLGAFENVIKTLREAFTTTQDKLEKVRKQIQDGTGVLSETQLEELKTEQAILENQMTGEKLYKSLNSMVKLGEEAQNKGLLGKDYLKTQLPQFEEMAKSMMDGLVTIYGRKESTRLIGELRDALKTGDMAKYHDLSSALADGINSSEIATAAFGTSRARAEEMTEKVWRAKMIDTAIKIYEQMLRMTPTGSAAVANVGIGTIGGVAGLVALTANLSSALKLLGIGGGGGGGAGAVGVGSKALKFLGPIGALLTMGFGAYSGATNPGNRGVGEAATLGVLTGNAKKGSVMSSAFGIGEGTEGDEMMGVAGAGLHGAAVGAGIGVLGGPWGIAIGAFIGAIVGAIAELYKLATDVESKVGPYINDMWSKISEGWEELKKNVTEAWNDIVKEFEGLDFSSLKPFIDDVKNFFEETDWKTVFETIGKIGKWLFEYFGFKLKAIGKLIQGAIQPLWKAIGPIIEGITRYLSGFMKVLRGIGDLDISKIGEGLWDMLMGQLKVIGETILTIIYGIPSAIYGALEKLAEWLGLSNLATVFRGLKEVFQSVATIIRGIFNWDWDIIKKGLNDLWNGFRNLIDGIYNMIIGPKIKGMWEDLSDWIMDMFDGISGAIIKVLNKVLDFVGADTIEIPGDDFGRHREVRKQARDKKKKDEEVLAEAAQQRAADEARDAAFNALPQEARDKQERDRLARAFANQDLRYDLLEELIKTINEPFNKGPLSRLPGETKMAEENINRAAESSGLENYRIEELLSRFGYKRDREGKFIKTTDVPAVGLPREEMPTPMTPAEVAAVRQAALQAQNAGRAAGEALRQAAIQAAEYNRLEELLKTIDAPRAGAGPIPGGVANINETVQEALRRGFPADKIEELLTRYGYEKDLEGKFVKAALNPGSIYVHDISVENLLEELLHRNAEVNSRMMGDEDMDTRIAREMAMIEASGIVNEAQESVSKIKENTDAIKTDIHKQLEILQQLLILSKKTSEETSPGVNTEANTKGSIPFNDWRWVFQPHMLNILGNIQSPEGY
jgi:hypothetical protein